MPTLASIAPSTVVTGALLVTCAFAGCSLDGLLVTELGREGHKRMPDPASVVVTGTVPMLPGSSVTLVGPSGDIAGGATKADGSFRVELDGTSEVVNSVVSVRKGGQQLLGIVPLVPKQKSVLDPELVLDIAQTTPGMKQIDAVTTAMTVLVAARARAEKKTLTAIAHGSMTDTLIDLHSKMVAKTPELIAVGKMVQRIFVAGTKVNEPAPFVLTGKGSLLSQAFVQAAGPDLDGDGKADSSTKAFDDAVAKAIKSFKFKACYEPGKIRVVVLARMAQDAKNTNCEAINPFLWANDTPGRRMFLAGGVHKTTSVCSSEVTTNCLTKKQVDALNAVLGNWQPNKTPMYDDGSHGDGVAGDNVWTLSFEAPWWKVPIGGRGVRIAYKFTWGSEGANWGGTEEFPGNQRVLELKDVNEDGIIVRLDHFADETTNKDKANQLAPAKGGCGELKFPDEKGVDGCVYDVHERAVDLDGDCTNDDFPNPGTSAPLTVKCPGS